MLKYKKYIITAIVLIALFIKLFLFAYSAIFVPQAKFLPDSNDYLTTAGVLASQGVFARDNNGVLEYELLRTPGYPAFLSLLHFIMRIPLDGIVFIQLVLTVLSAFIVYKAAFEIDQRIAFLSAVIVLYSLPITICSLLVLSDTLFLFFITLFILTFIRYLKNNSAKLIFLSAVIIAAATYIRPVSHYFCLAAGIFILYANVLRKKFLPGIIHSLIFLFSAYILIGIWHFRNYIHFHQFIFTNIQTNYGSFPIFQIYTAKISHSAVGASSILDYINAFWHCFLSLMTRPGTLKYLNSHALTVAGKVFGYPFVVFWWIGLIVGLSRIKSNIYLQFIFLMAVYFIIVTILVVSGSSGERYFIPIAPLVAIISAAGWMKIKETLQK